MLEHWFSTFYGLRHTKVRKKTLLFIKAEKCFVLKITANIYSFFQKNSKSFDQKQLAAHLEGTHGTLVCRGTPVENHCARVMDYLLLDKSIII
jgi:hypothetical protein